MALNQECLQLGWNILGIWRGQDSMITYIASSLGFWLWIFLWTIVWKHVSEIKTNFRDINHPYSLPPPPECIVEVGDWPWEGSLWKGCIRIQKTCKIHGEKRLAQQPEKTKRKHLKKSSQLRAGTGAALTDGWRDILKVAVLQTSKRRWVLQVSAPHISQLFLAKCFNWHIRKKVHNRQEVRSNECHEHHVGPWPQLSFPHLRALSASYRQGDASSRYIPQIERNLTWNPQMGYKKESPLALHQVHITISGVVTLPISSSFRSLHVNVANVACSTSRVVGEISRATSGSTSALWVDRVWHRNPPKPMGSFPSHVSPHEMWVNSWETGRQLLQSDCTPICNYMHITHIMMRLLVHEHTKYNMCLYYTFVYN